VCEGTLAHPSHDGRLLEFHHLATNGNMWMFEYAFVLHGHDSHVFRHTSAAKFAAFRNHDGGPALRIEIESTFRPGTTLLDSLMVLE
jgi:hypothetical protein